jgi:Domain of unknown function (DUF4263)
MPKARGPVLKRVQQFEKMLNEKLLESDYQRFLEENPEFLVRPFILNHQLHFNAIVSQFRLSTSLTADFCYLTKSSNSWNVVLVEVERPNIPLFLNNKLQLTPTAQFTARQAQIQTWKDEVAVRHREIVSQLDAIRKPLARNIVNFKYVLIIGRDSAPDRQEVRDRIHQLNGHDLRILTFDSLLRHYTSGEGRKCNIITFTKGKVSFKYLHVDPHNMFNYVAPSDVLLKEAHKRKLRRFGVSVKAWETNTPISACQHIAKILRRKRKC